MLMRDEVMESMESLERAWVELGRAQHAGKRGRSERERMAAASQHFWLSMQPYIRARNRELARARRAVKRLLMAMVLLP